MVELWQTLHSNPNYTSKIIQQSKICAQ